MYVKQSVQVHVRHCRWITVNQYLEYVYSEFGFKTQTWKHEQIKVKTKNIYIIDILKETPNKLIQQTSNSPDGQR